MLQYNISVFHLTTGKYVYLFPLITVVMGYFLGITVSTVVDYRLKDANKPSELENKIMVNLNDSDIMETFKSSSKKVRNHQKQTKARKVLKKR